jgi:hypothetical protein
MAIDVTKNERILIPSIVGHLKISNDNQSAIFDIIKKELLLFGPITISFPATEEFLHYSEGISLIYQRKNPY